MFVCVVLRVLVSVCECMCVKECDRENDLKGEKNVPSPVLFCSEL